MKNTTETSALSLLANDAGYDPLEDRLRENIRSTIEAVFEEELAQFLGRCRYGREDALRQGYRNWARIRRQKRPNPSPLRIRKPKEIRHFHRLLAGNNESCHSRFGNPLNGSGP